MRLRYCHTPGRVKLRQENNPTIWKAHIGSEKMLPSACRSRANEGEKFSATSKYSLDDCSFLLRCCLNTVRSTASGHRAISFSLAAHTSCSGQELMNFLKVLDRFKCHFEFLSGDGQRPSSLSINDKGGKSTLRCLGVCEFFVASFLIQRYRREMKQKESPLLVKPLIITACVGTMHVLGVK